jgi:hypothetical protein
MKFKKTDGVQFLLTLSLLMCIERWWACVVAGVVIVATSCISYKEGLDSGYDIGRGEG